LFYAFAMPETRPQTGEVDERRDQSTDRCPILSIDPSI
jgi:hypothetical protein